MVKMRMENNLELTNREGLGVSAPFLRKSAASLTFTTTAGSHSSGTHNNFSSLHEDHDSCVQVMMIHREMSTGSTSTLLLRINPGSRGTGKQFPSVPALFYTTLGGYSEVDFGLYAGILVNDLLTLSSTHYHANNVVQSGQQASIHPIHAQPAQAYATDLLQGQTPSLYTVYRPSKANAPLSEYGSRRAAMAAQCEPYSGREITTFACSGFQEGYVPLALLRKTLEEEVDGTGAAGGAIGQSRPMPHQQCSGQAGDPARAPDNRNDDVGNDRGNDRRVTGRGTINTQRGRAVRSTASRRRRRKVADTRTARRQRAMATAKDDLRKEGAGLVLPPFDHNALAHCGSQTVAFATGRGMDVLVVCNIKTRRILAHVATGSLIRLVTCGIHGQELDGGLVVASGTYAVSVFNLPSLRLVDTVQFESPVLCVASNPFCMDEFAILTNDGTVYVWGLYPQQLYPRLVTIPLNYWFSGSFPAPPSTPPTWGRICFGETGRTLIILYDNCIAHVAFSIVHSAVDVQRVTPLLLPHRTDTSVANSLSDADDMDMPCGVAVNGSNRFQVAIASLRSVILLDVRDPVEPLIRWRHPQHRVFPLRMGFEKAHALRASDAIMYIYLAESHGSVTVFQFSTYMGTPVPISNPIRIEAIDHYKPSWDGEGNSVVTGTAAPEAPDMYLLGISFRIHPESGAIRLTVLSGDGCMFMLTYHVTGGREDAAVSPASQVPVSPSPVASPPATRLRSSLRTRLDEPTVTLSDAQFGKNMNAMRILEAGFGLVVPVSEAPLPLDEAIDTFWVQRSMRAKVLDFVTAPRLLSEVVAWMQANVGVEDESQTLARSRKIGWNPVVDDSACLVAYRSLDRGSQSWPALVATLLGSVFAKHVERRALSVAVGRVPGAGSVSASVCMCDVSSESILPCESDVCVRQWRFVYSLRGGLDSAINLEQEVVRESSHSERRLLPSADAAVGPTPSQRSILHDLDFLAKATQQTDVQIPVTDAHSQRPVNPQAVTAMLTRLEGHWESWERDNAC